MSPRAVLNTPLQRSICIRLPDIETWSLILFEFSCIATIPAYLTTEITTTTKAAAAVVVVAAAAVALLCKHAQPVYEGNKAQRPRTRVGARWYNATHSSSLHSKKYAVSFEFPLPRKKYPVGK